MIANQEPAHKASITHSTAILLMPKHLQFLQFLPGFRRARRPRIPQSPRLINPTDDPRTAFRIVATQMVADTSGVYGYFLGINETSTYLTSHARSDNRLRTVPDGGRAAIANGQSSDGDIDTQVALNFPTQQKRRISWMTWWSRASSARRICRGCVCVFCALPF